MSSLVDLPELVGFFSYSREDDEGSDGALSALRERIQHELRGQLGRSFRNFRLWQDKESIASGTLWETEINNAVAQSVFFIPIVTPTVVKSPYCKFELESFLAREAALGRGDLIFPILYIEVPDLEDAARSQGDPVLSLIAKRQYVDWSEFRHLDVNATEVRRAVSRFCADIRNALRRSWISPEEREQREAGAAQERAEAEQRSQETEEKSSFTTEHVSPATLPRSKTSRDTTSSVRWSIPLLSAVSGLWSKRRSTLNTGLPERRGEQKKVWLAAMAGIILLAFFAIYWFQPVCFDQLCGTTWGISNTVENFQFKTFYRVVNTPDDANGGHYRLYGTNISINLRGNEYQGTIAGDTMRGTEHNAVGRNWTWSATKIRH
jgi:hypothetical protein